MNEMSSGDEDVITMIRYGRYEYECEPNLLTVCHHGDIDSVKRILKTKINYKETSEFPTYTPSRLAAGAGFGDVVLLLIEHNAVDIFTPSVDGHSLLHLAAGHASFPSRGLRDLVIYLLDIADPARIDSCISINTRSSCGSTALDMAMDHGTIAAMELLLSRKADPCVLDNEGKTPLIRAAWQADEKDIAKIMAIIPFMTEDDLNIQDVDGNTAMHAVVLGGVIMGNYVFAGQTERQMRILDMLMKGRASMLIKNNEGDNPYDSAIKLLRTRLANMIKTEIRRIAALQAFCMCLHPRLGRGTGLFDFDPGLIKMIAASVDGE